MDGVIYASVSQNLANGFGTPFDLHQSQFLSSHFQGHPPLAIWLESLFFYVFGSSFLIERFYSLLTYLVSGFIIHKIWKIAAPIEVKEFSFLPVFIWLVTPLVFWGASNNMLENTLTIFVLGAVFFMLKHLRKRSYLNLIIAGVLLFCGFMSKGFVGFFPLAFLGLAWIFKFGTLKFKEVLFDSINLVLWIIIPAGIMFMVFPQSLESLEAYLNIQVLDSIKNGNKVNSRWFIIGKMVLEFIPGVALFLLSFFIGKMKEGFKGLNLKFFLLFFSLGLCGVFPIMVTLKQSGFYIIPALPFFALGFAFLIANKWKILTGLINNSKKATLILKYTTVALLCLSIGGSVYFSGKIGRDKNQLNDVYKVIEHTGSHEIIGIKKSMFEEWSLHAYFQRYGFISLDPKNPFARKYTLIPKTDNTEIPGGLEIVDINLTAYKLVLNPNLEVSKITQAFN